MALAIMLVGGVLVLDRHHKTKTVALKQKHFFKSVFSIPIIEQSV